MIILDTNIVSEMAKPDMDVRVKAWFSSQQRASLFTTAVTLAEMSFGVEIMPSGQRKALLKIRTEEIFGNSFRSRILPFDDRAARLYGVSVAAARAKGKAILIADGQIAAIALAHGFAVATRDAAPFEAADVPVINPWAL